MEKQGRFDTWNRDAVSQEALKLKADVEKLIDLLEGVVRALTATSENVKALHRKIDDLREHASYPSKPKDVGAFWV
jgi:hypothetical protein